jgi:hypothetical protein
MRCFYCCLLLLFCSTREHAQKNSCFSAWSGDDAQKSSDFLSILDADPAPPGRGQALVFFHRETTPADVQPTVFRQQASGQTHTAKLTWKASSSHVAGYNVYRSEVSGQKYQKINSSLIQGLTYADNTVQSGVTYYYVTRAVDDQGHESTNSNETSVSVP